MVQRFVLGTLSFSTNGNQWTTMDGDLVGGRWLDKAKQECEWGS
jgi:hypothetical protein